ncbi:Response regulator rcp1 [Aquisphaera giovannonii]|uniref:Response regulator rcp1 n=1 Tax=Aquisphaera giovannonii TaxID=406548 RepID=A0A5B9WDR7_9BACT|nr:response regulator [Aquisphaera giovannonii]QEH38040.1 Response regulator rcp1 [Aquisphaera giovannonii]
MNLGEFRVLVVEDDSTDALMIRRAFRKANVGNPLQFVDNGDSAVDYLAGRSPFDDRAAYPLPGLVLLDLKLPRRSGLEVLQWLKEQPGLRRIPVVVLTSSMETADVRKAYDLGCNSYLVKPVHFEGLLQAIRAVGPYWLAMNHAPDTEKA